MYKSLSGEPICTPTSYKQESLWIHILWYTMDPCCQVDLQVAGSVYLPLAIYNNVNFCKLFPNLRIIKNSWPFDKEKLHLPSV